MRTMAREKNVGARMPAEVVERVEAWRKRQPAKTSMGAAVVALVKAGLSITDAAAEIDRARGTEVTP